MIIYDHISSYLKEKNSNFEPEKKQNVNYAEFDSERIKQKYNQYSMLKIF